MRSFLTFDIGGTIMKHGIIKEDGTLVTTGESLTRAEKGGPYILEQVKKIGREYQKTYDFKGICISTAGQVDSRLGQIIYALPDIIPHYTGMRVKESLEAYFGLPVEVENDVNCVGLSEAWLGMGKGVKSLFCLTIGTGIGGSFVLDHHLHTGNSYSAGEIGYIEINGAPFQTLASTKSLVQKVAYKKGIRPTQTNGKKIFEQAQNGDQVCIDAIDELIVYLSKGISTIVYMMNPEMVVIGGGISHQSAYLYPRIMNQLKKDLLPELLEKTKIDFAKNLNYAGLIGALRHFIIQETTHPLNKIVTAIESNRHKLTRAEHKIADFIVNNLSEVPNLTISEMATQSHVANASISRFCKKIDIETYNHLRILASNASVSKRKVEEVSVGRLDSVKERYDRLIANFSGFVSSRELNKLRIQIERARRIFIIGTKEIQPALAVLRDRLMLCGKDVQLFTDDREIGMSKKIISDEVLVLAVNISGYDKSLVDYIRGLNNKNISVALTSQADSPLSRIASKVVVAPIAEVDQHTTAHLFTLYYLIDLLLLELEEKTKEQDQEDKKENIHFS